MTRCIHTRSVNKTDLEKFHLIFFFFFGFKLNKHWILLCGYDVLSGSSFPSVVLFPELVCFCFPPLSSCDSVTLCSLLSPTDWPLFTGEGSSTDSSVLMEGEDCAMGASDESPSEVDFSVGTDSGLAGTVYQDSSGDGGSMSPERLVSVKAAKVGPGTSWALAMFGEDSFSKDVIQYAKNLGQHTSVCLDVKIQVGETAENSE